MESNILKLKKKSQTLSADLIIVVAFVLLASIFVVFTQINSQQERNFEEVRQGSKVVSDSIFNQLVNSNIIGRNNDVDLVQLKQINEEELRRELNINGDFAIAFEKDGQLIYIDAEEGISCIGSNKILINDVNCGFFE
ncbi:MAG: hypothetical protein LAT82_04990 [Nanoarchaeota archaeon]|nr:hypothetical protein [Nanoarchaeota archaeon]